MAKSTLTEPSLESPAAEESTRQDGLEEIQRRLDELTTIVQRIAGMFYLVGNAAHGITDEHVERWGLSPSGGEG